MRGTLFQTLELAVEAAGDPRNPHAERLGRTFEQQVGAELGGLYQPGNLIPEYEYERGSNAKSADFACFENDGTVVLVQAKLKRLRPGAFFGYDLDDLTGDCEGALAEMVWKTVRYLYRAECNRADGRLAPGTEDATNRILAARRFILLGVGPCMPPIFRVRRFRQAVERGIAAHLAPEELRWYRDNANRFAGWHILDLDDIALHATLRPKVPLGQAVRGHLRKMGQQPLVDALTPFVIAAGTRSLAPACRLLFLHGRDLTWGSSSLGMYVVRVRAQGALADHAEILGARGQIEINRLARIAIQKAWHLVVPLFRDLVHEFEGRKGAGTEMAFGAAFSQRLMVDPRIKAVFSDLFDTGFDEVSSLVQFGAGWLCREFLNLRRRQLASSGYSDAEYDEMIEAAQRLEGVCDPVLRLSFSETGRLDSVSLATGPDGARPQEEVAGDFVELCRLRPGFSKVKGEPESALQLFVASYLNQRHPGPQVAFPNARYGEASSPEFDVVVPELDLGIEVKLYQSACTVADNQLAQHAVKLRAQLARYRKAGFRKVLVVSNLPPHTARQLLDQAAEDQPWKAGLLLQPASGGLDVLLPILDRLSEELRSGLWQRFVQEVEQGPSGEGETCPGPKAPAPAIASGSSPAVGVCAGNVVVGVDGCKGGWVAVSLDRSTGKAEVHVHPTFRKVLDVHPDAVICADVPIGLLDAAQAGGRECDRVARRALGSAGSSVFPAPARPALRARTHTEAVALNRDSSAEGIGLSIQAFSIFPRIREVDEAMTPSLQERVFEVHPELCFREMPGGAEPMVSKKKAEGRKARRALLEAAGFGTVLHLTSEALRRLRGRPAGRLRRLLDRRANRRGQGAADPRIAAPGFPRAADGDVVLTGGSPG